MNTSKLFFILSIVMLITLALNPLSQEVQASASEAETLIEESNLDFVLSQTKDSADRDTSDPDDFGYTRVTPAAYSWIDVSGGTDTGIDYDTVKSTGAIPIGFTFDYYENSYTELYISVFGYVAFNNVNIERTQPGDIPSIETPNDVIAPLWTNAQSINYVRYQTIGSSPNRQFVVEWNQFTTDSGDSQYTFEVILHESGDITFQYHTIVWTGSGFSRYAGIENSRGDDGLPSYFFKYGDFESNTAEQYIRPTDHANPLLSPSSQGDLMGADETISYPVTLLNYGSVGTDTYTITSESDWSLALYEDDKITPLSNPISLAQGDSYDFIVTITSPSIAVPTETNIAEITAISNLDPTASHTVQIINAFPAPFAQFVDFDANDGMLTTLNAGPDALVRTDFLGESVEGDTAIIELPNHNLFYAWSERICLDAYCNTYDQVIKYTILNAYGPTVLAPTVLVDTTVMDYDVRDGNAYLAVTPEGNIGILWHREIYDSSTYNSNNNAFFAILSQDGAGFILEPQNFTGNAEFCPFYDSSCTNQHYLMLSSTPDENFFLMWRESPSHDFKYKIYDDAIETLSATTTLVGPVLETEYLSDFTLTGLVNNNYFIAWTYINMVEGESGYEWTTEMQYTVLNSSGSVVFPQTSIPDIWLASPDSTQLSNGNIILAHDNLPDTSFMLFDGNTYAPLTPMTVIPGQVESWSPGNVSVVRGPYGTAIITLQNYPEEEDVWQIFYTLIDSDGTLKTPLISFFETPYDSLSYHNYITSERGQGSTILMYDYTPFFRSTPVTEAVPDELYTYSIITDDGNLPDDTLTITGLTIPTWLSVIDNGDGTATLSGTPTEESNYAIVLRVEDGIGYYEDQTFTIEVKDNTPYFYPIFFK